MIETHNGLTIKSNVRTTLFRIASIVIFSVAIINYDINNVFFGFLIILSIIFFLFVGTDSITVTENNLIFKFQRLIPIGTRVKIIDFKDIQSVELYEGKISGASLLNLIEYVPGMVKPDDEIELKLRDGGVYRHDGIGTKKQLKQLLTIIEEKIKTTR